MCLTEYNEAEAMELFKEEGRSDARADDLRSLMINLKLTVEQAMDAISIPENKRSYYKGLVGTVKSE